MNILIIVDEIKTAKSLAQIIKLIRTDAKIIEIIQSIKKAVSYLTEILSRI